MLKKLYGALWSVDFSCFKTIPSLFQWFRRVLQIFFCCKAWGWVDDDWILILGAAHPLSVASSPRGPVFGKILEVFLREREKCSPAATTVCKEIKEVEKKNADWSISFLNSQWSGGGQIVWLSVNNSHWSGSKSSALLYFHSHGYFSLIYWGSSLTYGQHWKPIIHNTPALISAQMQMCIYMHKAMQRGDMRRGCRPLL